MFQRIDRYLFRQVIVPMLATLCIAAILLLLEKMLRLFDFVVNEGGPISVVWRMLANLVPQYLSLAIPIGLFLGVLLGFRKLALNSELDALIGTGISHDRLMRVPLLLAGVSAVISYFLMGYVQPLTRYAYEGLQFDLRSGALGASIKVGEFVELGGGLTLRIEESREGGRELMRIFLQKTLAKGGEIVATAKAGTFYATEDRDKILFRLYDGTLITLSPKLASPRTLTFEVHDLPIELPKSAVFRARGGAHLELTIPELVTALLAGDVEGAQRGKFAANLNFRLIHILTLFVLPFLALPMGIPPKRSASAVGVFAGVGLLVLYNEISELGEKISAAGEAPIVVTLWIPFFLFILFSLQLYRVAVYRVGGQPLRFLDLAASWVGRQFVRLRAMLTKEATS
ncbi:MAG: LptF/LptG family permease [Pseudomonadota bacterium]